MAFAAVLMFLYIECSLFFAMLGCNLCLHSGCIMAIGKSEKLLQRSFNYLTAPCTLGGMNHSGSEPI